MFPAMINLTVSGSNIVNGLLDIATAINKSGVLMTLAGVRIGHK